MVRTTLAIGRGVDDTLSIRDMGTSTKRKENQSSSKILFDSGASPSFVAPSSVDVLGLEVETLDEQLYMSSPLGTRVRIDQICRDCELEISGILLTVDLRVMNISDFDVILGMNCLTAHRIVIDCDSKRISAYTLDGICVTFQGGKHDALPQIVHDSIWSGQLMGWLASLTLENEVRQELDLSRVVCEYGEVFPDELPDYLRIGM